jgi:hypothetical protein
MLVNAHYVVVVVGSVVDVDSVEASQIEIVMEEL